MMKPRTSNSVADIAKFVAAGHAQSAANCRVLLDEIERLRIDVQVLRKAGAIVGLSDEDRSLF